MVLLDLGLPDVDGLSVCREIHSVDPTVDVLMLTARDEELDVVVGLDAGAIDYVTKPFKLAELLARIRAQLRRAEPHPLSRSTVGDLVIDIDARRVWLAGHEIGLRAKEFDLLSRLIALANTGATDLAGFEIFYTFTDPTADATESYYFELPDSFTIPAGGRRIVHFDNTGAPDHFPVNEFSLYSTSLDALDVSVTVSAAGAAPQTATVQKDAGGEETAD